MRYKYFKIAFGEEMKSSIVNYIEYLKSEHGLQISLHGEGILPYLDFLAEYNSHECAYCMFVKTASDSWNRCIIGQRKAFENLLKCGEYYGSCYAGVGEFVFPIRAFDKTVGMISVGSFLGSAEKYAAFSEKYGFGEKKLGALAKAELKESIPSFSFVKTLIEPLGAMLTLLIEKNGAVGTGGESLYGKILSILHTEYTRKLKISDIAAECHYSTAFISRYFKNKSGITVNEYLKILRMKKAESLLLNTEMRIEDVAASVGFTDTNYFISFFSDYYGIPPKKYRSQKQNKSI